jgi:hypothetical protein
VFKPVYPDPTIGAQNSGALRPLFWKKDQMEVDIATSPTLEKNDQMELDTLTGSLKRLIVEKAANKDNKKTKSQALVQRSVPIGAPHTKYWLGFSTMEKLAEDSGIEELLSDETVADKVTRGIPQLEAEEMENAQASYPRIPQQLYPKERSDNIPGQHYNITQIPFDIPTNPDIGTDLIDPVTILCKHAKEGEQKGIWSGIIKLHLLRPEVDGINLLKGLRPFILRLDEDEAYIGKVCKGYDAIVDNNNLLVLIKSENLERIKAQDLFKEILENSFARGHDFEITSIQKGTLQRHAYIVAPTPQQAKKIELHQTRNYSQGVTHKGF